MIKEIPLQHLWLELTSKCNLACSHCYTESSPDLPLITSMSLDDWQRILNDSSIKGCKSLQLIGGEPLLHPNITEIVEYAISKNFETIEIFTNATFINESHLKLFKKYKIKVATSFYSHIPDTHDKITNKKNSFQKTVQGIINLINNNIELRVAIVQMSLNYNDIPLSKSFLRTLGVNQISVDRERSIGRGENNSTEKLFTTDDVCGNCWNGKLCVTSNGDVYPCIMSRSTLVGNILESEIDDILNDNKLIDYRKKIKRIFTKNLTDLVSNCGPNGGGCGPDRDCGPDHRIQVSANEKEALDNCGPNGGGCGPDRGCGPDHRIQVSANEKEALDNCGPNGGGCGPDRGGCGPDRGGCNPDRLCGPDQRAEEPDNENETLSNCGPDHGCAPDRGCGPDRRGDENKEKK